MGKIWAFIQGKKTSIATSIALATGYLEHKQVIDNETELLILGILTAFGITANVSNAVATRRAKKDA